MEKRIHLNETEKKYNEVCGITFAHIHTITQKCDTIPFWDIDIDNEEHLYALSVGVALGGAIGKKVSAWGSRWFIHKLNKKLGLKKDARIVRMSAKDTMFAIRPEFLVGDLRIEGIIRCGSEFTFADIYHEFYEIKKGK